MTELETMRRAKMYMDKLAQGVDPVTDRQIPGDSALNNPRLSRCFAYVSGVLDQVIANGGKVTAGQPTRPFSITPEQLSRVRLSAEPVKLSWLLDALSEAVGDPEMKKLSPVVLSDWLVEQGLLEKHTDPEGQNHRLPTEAGVRLGLSTQMVQGRQQPYTAVLYDTRAQIYILDHIFEILQRRKHKNTERKANP